MQPNGNDYARALTAVCLGNKEVAMLRAHYFAPNRVIGWRELGEAAFKGAGPGVACRWYCTLGLRVGEALGLSFPRLEGDEYRYCSVLATGDPQTMGLMEHQLTMRRALAEALDQLGWFKAGP